jgi:hypothetical protein
VPESLIALLPVIFGGIGAGTALGGTIYNAVSSGGSPPSVSTPPSLPPTPASTTTAPGPQQIYSANANEQASTGGSFGLSPQAQSSLIDLLSAGGGSGGSAGGVNFGGYTS